MRDGFDIETVRAGAVSDAARATAPLPPEPDFELTDEAFGAELGFRTGMQVIVNSGHMVPVRLQVTEVFRRDDAGEWSLIHRHSSVATQ